MTKQKELYQSFCEQHAVPLFHQVEWWDALTSSWDVAVARLDEHWCFFPYSLEQRLGFKLIRNPHLTPYSGFLFSEQTPHPIQQQLAIQVASTLPAFDYFNVDLSPELGSMSWPLPFNQAIKRTTILPLADKSPDDLFRQFKSSLQRQIRKAEKAGLVVDNELKIEEFLTVHEQSFQRQGKQPDIPKQYFYQLVELLKKKNCGELLMARDAEAQIHAALIRVWDTTTAYYLSGGTSESGLHSGAMSYLMWKAIQRSREQGLNQFDFEGSMEAGIHRFFRNFGGDEVFYVSLHKTNSTLFQLAQKLKSFTK